MMNRTKSLLGLTAILFGLSCNNTCSDRTIDNSKTERRCESVLEGVIEPDVKDVLKGYKELFDCVNVNGYTFSLDARLSDKRTEVLIKALGVYHGNQHANAPKITYSLCGSGRRGDGSLTDYCLIQRINGKPIGEIQTGREFEYTTGVIDLTGRETIDIYLIPKVDIEFGENIVQVGKLIKVE